ncbi:outer membrane usher protein [Pseudomonas turukhanskensis]|uniref:Outer membrane usher protein n=1 Tax=Pseudomonas turukhanskensis TaxID=1806536 RepID=A0A9W6NDW4_9PSED|nr:outer membrane usher protein [Pseudomonas turukhanskensis]
MLRAAAGAAAQFLVTVLTSVAYGDERTAYLEFDNRMLWGTPSDKESADLSRFSEGNPVPAGTMSVQLFLNGNPRKMLDVYFKPVAGKKSAVACFTPIDIKSAGVALDKLPEDMVRWLQDSESKTTCKPIAEVVPSASAAFDFSEQRLDLTIPQAYLKELPADYIDPEQWERGITAARLNYTLDVFNSKSSGVNSTQGFGHFESGFNTLGWRLRNISSVTSSKHGNTFQAQRTYAQTDIEPIKSTLTLGQSFTDGQLLNSYGLQGAFLATDPRMLPSSLRNYAPVVSGVADSNAKVTIRQNGVVIYERAVPPGPFEIKNLQAVGYGNDLEVTVTEADGSEKKFSVPYSPLVQLLRPGQSKYSASVGEAWSPSFNNYKPLAGQFNYQYGVNNYLTASAGALVSEDYMAVALGSAVSTYIGGLSADYTHSNSRSDSTGAVNGDSLRFVYSTLIAPTKTNITLSSYRYSSQDYWSFNEFLSHENRRDKRSWKDPDFYYFYGAKQKGRFDISLRQRLPGALGNVSLRASTRNYWNREGTDTQYQLSYGNNFKSLSYNLSASRVKNQNNQQYDEFRLNISLPLSFSDYGRTYLSSTAWKHSESGSVGQLQLGGIAGADQQITYGVTTTQTLDNQNRQESYGVSGGYQGSNGYVTAGTSRGNGYQQSSLGVAGSVLAHSDGLTFGQTLGDTVALVEAENGGGARITNASGAKVNGSGYGVVPYLTPYSRNRIELDPEGLSPDLEFKHTSAESIPVDGSIVKIKFETTKESTLFIRATFADGSPLPFGAEVVDATSKNLVGYVGQAGGVVARGVGENSQLEVKLEKNHCVLELKVESESVNKNHPGAINNALGICKFE